MFGLNFSRLPTPRKFNYKPMFYDPNMDDLKERVKKAKIEMGEGPKRDVNQIKENIKLNFQKKYHAEYSQTPEIFRKLRVFLIAIILGFITYHVFNSSLIDIIIQGFLVK
jgi:hypothetical protein